jgi:hypothetical protein
VVKCRGMTSSLVKSLDDPCDGAEQRVALGRLPKAIETRARTVGTRPGRRRMARVTRLIVSDASVRPVETAALETEPPG